MHARPNSLERALELLDQGSWSILAGGTDYYPGLRDRAPTGAVIDITSIAALRQIVIDDQHSVYRIGALTTWSDLVAAELPPAFDALKAAAIEVGSIQIQNRATIAGNLCNASPAADGVPPLLCLDADVELASAAGTRRVALGQFIQGNRKIERNANEMVTAILVPLNATRGHSAFLKLGARRFLVISISMVSANLELDADGRIKKAWIAVGSCSEVAMRLPSLEQALTGLAAAGFSADQGRAELADVIATTVRADLKPIDDVRASRLYRLQAAAELILRVIASAVTSAQGSQA